MHNFNDHGPSVRKLVRKIEEINLMSSNGRIDRTLMIVRAANRFNLTNAIIEFNISTHRKIHRHSVVQFRNKKEFYISGETAYELGLIKVLNSYTYKITEEGLNGFNMVLTSR